MASGERCKIKRVDFFLFCSVTDKNGRQCVEVLMGILETVDMDHVFARAKF